MMNLTANLVHCSGYATSICRESNQSISLLQPFTTLRKSNRLPTFRTLCTSTHDSASKSSEFFSVFPEPSSTLGLEPSKRLILLNNLLNKRVDEGQHRYVNELFEHLPQYQLEPNEYTYAISLKSSKKQGNVPRMLELVKEMEARQLPLDKYIFGTLLDTFGSTGNTEQESQLFEQLERSGKMEPFFVLTMLNHLGQQDHKKMMNRYLEYYHRRLPISAKTYGMMTSLLVLKAQNENKFSYQDLPQYLETIVQHIAENPVERINDEVIDNIFKLYLYTDDSLNALLFLDFLKSPKIGINLNATHYNHLLQLYGRRADNTAVRELVSQMKDSGLKLDSRSYNAILKGQYKSEHYDNMIETFGEMVKEKSLKPDNETMIEMMKCYIKRNDATNAELCFSSLKNDGVTKPEMYYHMMDMYSFSHFDKVMDLYEELKEANRTKGGRYLRPRIFYIVLSSCIDHQRMDLYDRVFKEMLPECRPAKKEYFQHIITKLAGMKDLVRLSNLLLESMYTTMDVAEVFFQYFSANDVFSEEGKEAYVRASQAYQEITRLPANDPKIEKIKGQMRSPITTVLQIIARNAVRRQPDVDLSIDVGRQSEAPSHPDLAFASSTNTHRYSKSASSLPTESSIHRTSASAEASNSVSRDGYTLPKQSPGSAERFSMTDSQSNSEVSESNSDLSRPREISQTSESRTEKPVNSPSEPSVPKKKYSSLSSLMRGEPAASKTSEKTTAAENSSIDIDFSVPLTKPATPKSDKPSTKQTISSPKATRGDSAKRDTESKMARSGSRSADSSPQGQSKQKNVMKGSSNSRNEEQDSRSKDQSRNSSPRNDLPSNLSNQRGKGNASRESQPRQKDINQHSGDPADYWISNSTDRPPAPSKTNSNVQKLTNPVLPTGNPVDASQIVYGALVALLKTGSFEEKDQKLIHSLSTRLNLSQRHYDALLRVAIQQNKLDKLKEDLAADFSDSSSLE